MDPLRLRRGTMCNAPGGLEKQSEKWTYFWSRKMSRRNWNPETVFSSLVSSPFWISRLVLQLGSTTWFYFLTFRAVNPRQKSWRKLGKIPRGIQDRIPGKESRRGIQEKNPGEERNLEPSYRRGRHGRHGRLNELNELNSLIARVCKGLRWFARACKDLRTPERLCKGLQGLARRSSSCARRRSSCARRRNSGIQNHVWKSRVYLFIIFI